MYPRCSASKTTIDIFVIVVFHPHGMIFSAVQGIGIICFCLIFLVVLW